MPYLILHVIYSVYRLIYTYICTGIDIHTLTNSFKTAAKSELRYPWGEGVCGRCVRWREMGAGFWWFLTTWCCVSLPADHLLLCEGRASWQSASGCRSCGSWKAPRGPGMRRVTDTSEGSKHCYSTHLWYLIWHFTLKLKSCTSCSVDWELCPTPDH